MSRLTATLALAALLTGSFTQAAEPEYVTIAMEIDVAKPAAEAWAKVGGYCDISKWANLACEITSGDGGMGTVRVLDKGRVAQSNFDDYTVMRLAQMPKVETVLVPSGGFWGGVGEPTIAVAAPAVMNAIFAATGKRVRSLPLTHHDLSHT